MKPAAWNRLAWATLLLAVAYALALWPPVRAWYSDVDKLVHGLVFAGVYAALVWALRWKPWALVVLALALGAAVEVHQFLLPGFSPSLQDWLADAVGIGLACAAHLTWQRWQLQTGRYMSGLPHSAPGPFAWKLSSLDWPSMAPPLRPAPHTAGGRNEHRSSPTERRREPRFARYEK
jgi:VanZ family protein